MFAQTLLFSSYCLVWRDFVIEFSAVRFLQQKNKNVRCKKIFADDTKCLYVLDVFFLNSLRLRRILSLLEISFICTCFAKDCFQGSSRRLFNFGRLNFATSFPNWITSCQFWSLNECTCLSHLLSEINETQIGRTKGRSLKTKFKLYEEGETALIIHKWNKFCYFNRKPIYFQEEKYSL